MSDESTGGEALPEGEEHAPEGVRVMGLVRWALVALAALAAAGTWTWWARSEPGLTRAADRFRCPMHPAVVQATAGSCPICGMDLVAAAAATAPAPAAAAPAAGAKGRYWCPMHPEVASDDPEARCEACGGMKLLPREAPAAGVAGLAPVDLGTERAQRMGVRTAKVERRRLSPALRTAGVVVAREDAVELVPARVTGWVREVRVQTGRRVAKGEVLAVVESPDLLPAQRAYVATTRWAEKQGAGGAGAPGYPLDASRRLEQLGVAKEDVARLGASEELSDRLLVRAPRAGHVARRGAVPGQYVQPGVELFQLADLSTVWVVADVYERDLARVREGQAARVSFAALPGESFAGTVRAVLPSVDAGTQTAQARIEVRNDGHRLRPGMSGDVELALAPADGLAVPLDAVADTGEARYVFVARGGGRFEPRAVRLGARDGERVQVLEGVAEGDEVVTASAFLVDSESRMRAAVQGFAAPDDASARTSAGTGR